MADSFEYYCGDCGKHYNSEGIRYLCPACNSINKPSEPPRGVLKVVYDYEAIRKQSGNLFSRLSGSGFLPLLPISSLDSLPPLRIGQTPVYKLDKLDTRKDASVVYIKDDAQNPTFSFKDRASALVSAWAKEQGILSIVAASTGNAGSSLAGICASQGQKAVIFVPATAPMAKLVQIIMYGARIIPVNGNYDNAFELSITASEKFGFYNRNTAFNPLTIEGKKTVAFEIFGQFNGNLPDRIFIPAGDGVILSGVYKGFEDLIMLGIIDKMPTLVAVQAAGSNNLIANLGQSEFIFKPSQTIADSISVDIPRNFHMAKHYLSAYQGETMEVSDEEILAASGLLARSTGIFTEPAAAAAFAGYLRHSGAGTSLVLLTGSGLKDLKAVQPQLTIPSPIDPDPLVLDKLF